MNIFLCVELFIFVFYLIGTFAEFTITIKDNPDPYYETKYIYKRWTLRKEIHATEPLNSILYDLYEDWEKEIFEKGVYIKNIF